MTQGNADVKDHMLGSNPNAVVTKKNLKTIVEEVSKKKIPITYNIFFYDTSSTSVIKEKGPV